MLFLLALAPTAHADRTWLQRTFGPADDDEDGIPDRDDNCPTIAEIVNGYADDDGCPDYLSFVTVQAVHAGRPLPFAEFWMQHAGRSYVANGPALSLENLVPGEKVAAAARHACLGGEGTARAGTDPVGIRLAMFAERTSPVTVNVVDGEGEPLDAVLLWTASDPSPCGPILPRQRVVDGAAVTELGIGTHHWLIRQRGKTSTGTLVVTEPGPHTIDVVLEDERNAGNERLSERLYFDSGKVTLGTDANAVLDVVLEQLQADPELQLMIEGHADTRASNRYNDDLAQRRADVVASALQARGIDPERLTTTTQGENEPADPGYGEQAHALNRRVEFVIRRPGEP